MSAKVEVAGAAELAATLRRAGGKLADCTAPNATASALIARQAATAAPHRTGRLAGSIRTRSNADGASIDVGAPYGRFVEYGTRYMRARPYLTPASAAVDWQRPYAEHVGAVMSTVRGA